MSSPKRRSVTYPVLFSAALLTISLTGFLSNLHFTVRFADVTPGLRFRSDPDSLFVRSATVFETTSGESTPTKLAQAMSFLSTRYGLTAACPPVPVVDIPNSNFFTGNIVLVNGAWAFYRTEDLNGGPCPATNLDPRTPALFMETIRQSGDFEVEMSVSGIPILWTPDWSTVQVLMLPFKDHLVVGGTYAAEHGFYELNEINPADLTSPFDDVLLGTMVLDWGWFKRNIAFESIEPNTTTPSGAKRQTLLLNSSLFGTGIFDVSFSAFATDWAPDPELTGNPQIGVPRNPILTPRHINFRYVGTATFPFDPATYVHATCHNDFSNPNFLQICPPNVPQD
jgi:hypothetical protein